MAVTPRYTVADQRFCFAIPDGYSDVEAAPLLCAGLIGYRSLIKAGTRKRLGHLRFRRRRAYHRPSGAISADEKFTPLPARAMMKPSDLPCSLGAAWAGGSNQTPPGETRCRDHLRPGRRISSSSLQAVNKGGTVVCGGIHMSDIPSFPYSLLWEERTITSVANLTRRDGEEFMALAPQVPVRTEVESFPLEDANEALHRLRSGKINGAAVLTTAALMQKQM